MKNLLNKGFLIDSIEDLPIDTLSLKIRKSHRIGWRWRKFSDNHTVGNIWPHDRARRLIAKAVGERFSEVFSKYCKQVPVYQQKFFLEELYPRNNYWWSWRTSYKVDVNGLIQIRKKACGYERHYTIQSKDAKWECRHKITGAIKPERDWWARSYQAIDDNDYHQVLVSGSAYRVSSSKDYRYVRYIAESKAASRKSSRDSKKKLEAIEYSFLSKDEIQKKKDKALDRIKILDEFPTKSKAKKMILIPFYWYYCVYEYIWNKFEDG